MTVLVSRGNTFEDAESPWYWFGDGLLTLDPGRSRGALFSVEDPEPAESVRKQQLVSGILLRLV